MDLIDFFNSPELELPGSWDTYSGSFEQYIAEVFRKYQINLNSIVAKDYLSRRVLQQAGVANLLCSQLQFSIQHSLNGNVTQGYAALSAALNQIQTVLAGLYTVDDISGALDHLYRIRKDSRPILSRGDLFHVPFQDRQKAATCRYSIAQLPCLYLGGSAYVCWEESGQPPLNSFHLSRFKPRAGKRIKVLDLGLRPALLAAMIDSGRYKSQLSGSSRASNLVVAHAVCWPLVAACSVKVKSQNGSLRPEYLVPQMVLQWLTNNTNIDGVRYFTTKVSQYHPDPVSISNYAFPVRTTKPTGYCDHLKARFQLSQPVFWPTVSPTAPAIGNTPHTNFTINIPATQYNQTDLGRLQHCAANMPCAPI